MAYMAARMPIKRKDVLIVGGFIIFATAVSLIFNSSLLTTLILFYGIPALWFSFKLPKYIGRAAKFALLGTALFLVIDYVATLDNAWWISTIFPVRIFGLLAIENSLWAFLGIFNLILFYEYFDNRDKGRLRENKRAYIAISLIGAIFIAFIFLFMFWPSLLNLQFAYLKLGIIFLLIPSIIVLALYPRLHYKFLNATIYFFFLHFAVELIIIHLGQATYPGQHFIGWVELGKFRFPFEELIFWILFPAVSILSYYEFFVDDSK